MLEEISDLRTKLEDLKNVEHKDTKDEEADVKKEIKRKEARYNQLQCGGIDPPRSADNIGP